MPGTGFLLGRYGQAGCGKEVHSHSLAIRSHQLVANVLKGLPFSCMNFFFFFS